MRDFRMNDYVTHNIRGTGKVIAVSTKKESKNIVALFACDASGKGRAALVRKEDCKLVEPAVQS